MKKLWSHMAFNPLVEEWGVKGAKSQPKVTSSIEQGSSTFVRILCVVKTSALPPPYSAHSKAVHDTECYANIVLLWDQVCKVWHLHHVAFCYAYVIAQAFQLGKHKTGPLSAKAGVNDRHRGVNTLTNYVCSPLPPNYGCSVGQHNHFRHFSDKISSSSFCNTNEQ